MSNYELLKLWYELKDGLGWNPEDKYASFQSEASAYKFKDAAPDWMVTHRFVYMKQAYVVTASNIPKDIIAKPVNDPFA